MRWQILLAAFGVIGSVDISSAADPRYPDWPCAQAKVPEISLAAVWAGPPLDDVKDKWKDDAKVSTLVTQLSSRRMSLDDAQKLAEQSLSGSSAEKSTMGKLLFAGLFDKLNAERSSVMNGLERVTRKQREAAQRIRADTAALHTLQDVSAPDQAGIDRLIGQLTWQTRIFEDRNKAVRYVCEVPTAIEKRLFALGRVIQQELD